MRTRIIRVSLDSLYVVSVYTLDEHYKPKKKKYIVGIIIKSYYIIIIIIYYGHGNLKIVNKDE